MTYLNDMYRYYKHKYYYNTEVDQINVNNPSNKLQMNIQVDPRTKQYLNVTVSVSLVLLGWVKR